MALKIFLVYAGSDQLYRMIDYDSLSVLNGVEYKLRVKFNVLKIDWSLLNYRL